MRRRLRQQTRMREALLVDLGALVYELHRHGRREPELLQAKASELTVVDQEVRALADALGAGEGELALVAAGIAGSCERCGTLLSTDARYCSGCGAEAAPSLPGSASAAAGQPVQPTARDLDPDATGVIGRAEPQAAAEPEPEAAAEPEPEAAAEPEPVSAHSEPAMQRDPEPGPPERTLWLASERDQPPASSDEEPAAAEPPPEAAAPTSAGEEPPVTEPPSAADPRQPSPTMGRRRSGGAVGKVAGLIRRPRDGG